MIRRHTGSQSWRRLSPFGLYRVAGDSMLPTYRPGDTLLGWRWIHRPRTGQVVVALSPIDGRPLIKRLARLVDSQAWIAGDNPVRSTDSRHFGPVPRGQIKAVIIARVGRGAADLAN